ncbi:MAG: PstS family phosphate ABC transporter substrate-binding protein [Candidatus Omnitrophota bacterium]
MKQLFSILLVTLFSLTAGQERYGQAEELKGTISISGAWALYPMAVKWAEEFQKIHPLVKIDVAAGGAGKGMADTLAKIVDIGAVSRDVYPAEIAKGAWWVAVTKDAVVPTINQSNPFLKEILTRGIKKESFIAIWVSGKITNWKDAAGVTEPPSGMADIHVYTRSDACGAAEIWAKYLGVNQENLLGIGVYGDPGLAEAVRKDSLGIGFNNISYVYDPDTRKPVEGIQALPIDLNGNARVDNDENFYSTRDEIMQAIITGKYPSPPARNLFFVCQGRPERPEVREFIRWVLTAGQEYVTSAGYVNLSAQALQDELKKLE